MNSDAVHTELLRFVEVLIEDADLRAWFESMEELAPALRHQAFLKIAAQMRAAGEHPELIHATELLAQDAIYQGVRQTLSEVA